MKRVLPALLMFVSALGAQGTKPREFPAQYTAHAQLGNAWIGADFHGHFANTNKASYETRAFLVVEVGLFAQAGKRIDIDPTQFVLQVNGHALMAQPPNLVSMTLKVPGMEQRGPHVEAAGGVGGVIVATGQPPVGRRFPTDTTPESNPPRPPKVDADPSRGSVTPEPVDPAEEIARAALETGTHATPIAGLLFYAWDGKLKKIKSLTLEYAGPMGKATLDLQ